MNILHLSDNLIRLRRERKLTQQELADFLGVTKAAVSKWENAQSVPDLLLLPQLATFFDVTIDELIGYEAQLSKEQIRRYYADLSKDFSSMPLADAAEGVRTLARRYYACYPFLLQLGVLFWNHAMLAETEEEREEMLREVIRWCDRILEHCSDVGVCDDALVLKAGVSLMLGRAAEAVELLEPSANPSRLATQNSGLLIQAYQAAGEFDKAKSYTQVKHYVDLLNLVEDAMLSLTLNETDWSYCEETIRRARGVMEVYQLETLHPNLAAQFHYQCAVAFAANGKDEEAVDALRRFKRCVDALLRAERIELHGDAYFDLLEEWIERLPLGGMAPRDGSFIRQNVREALEHPAFARVRNMEEFKKLVASITQKKT